MSATAMQWTPSDTRNAKYLGVLEFQDNKGEWHNFEVLQCHEPSDRIVFGGSCNVGFLESGFIRRDDCEHVDETLAEMLFDLEVYYNDGPQYVSRIVCNERM